MPVSAKQESLVQNGRDIDAECKWWTENLAYLALCLASRRLAFGVRYGRH